MEFKVLYNLMVSRIVRLLVFLVLLGWLAIGCGLWLGHFGLAIRLANYVFLLWAFVVLAGLLFFER